MKSFDANTADKTALLLLLMLRYTLFLVVFVSRCCSDHAERNNRRKTHVVQNRKDVLEAFASLVVGAYERNKPVAPECVVKASREWTETDDWKEKFTGLFEATGNDSDEMTPKQVYKIAKDNGILASENKMSRMMTQMGFTTTPTTRRGRKVRYYKGVKEMDDNRGWVGY